MTDWVTEAITLEATPKRLREETIVDFCARHEIERSTYYYEMSKEDNKKRVLEVTLNQAKDQAPEVLDTLVQKAKEGDMRAADLYLDHVLKLSKNLDLKSDGRAFVFMPSEIAAKNGINTSTERNS